MQKKFVYGPSDHCLSEIRRNQAKYSRKPQIPESVFNHIKTCIPLHEMTPQNIYIILKNDKFYRFIEHSNFIFQCLTGKKVPQLTVQQEKYLVFMFERLRSKATRQIPTSAYMGVLCDYTNFELDCRLPASSRYSFLFSEAENCLQRVLAESATKIQSCCRMHQTKKVLARMRIKQELEYLPKIGIKYLEGLHHFKQGLKEIIF